ncbi:hypothetical protein HPB48_008988 [Haemaphysalis longicornis]|uniref:Uncharacterized protein n=1 Tax=Haemaphysalis longicornis TaxID=44386 RepID=A0A9J6H378_HAELO|nr:hypothetical protein HPB48_008988 [Haemaphysalis longicornis]
MLPHGCNPGRVAAQVDIAVEHASGPLLRQRSSPPGLPWAASTVRTAHRPANGMAPSATSGNSSRPCPQSGAMPAPPRPPVAPTSWAASRAREMLHSVECYDPSVDAWSYVMSMLGPRSGLKAVVHDDVIYVLGGFDGTIRLETVERMDPHWGYWSELPSMTFPRSNFVAVLLEGSIYVAGRFNAATTVSLVERYDIQTRQWHRTPDMSITFSAAAGCVYQDIPNARDWL